MLRRLRRASIVATLLGTLLIPAVGSLADPDNQLDKARNDLAEIRERLEEKESKAGGLQARVDALNEEILALRAVITRLDEQIADIQSQVRSAQARIDATQAKIDKIHDQATAQAVALYKAGSTDVIDALLDSQSLAELDSRVEMLGKVASENTDALVQYGRLRVEIQAQHRELFQRKSELTDVRQEQAKAMSESREMHSRLAIALAEIEAKIDDLHHHEDLKEGVVARLEGTIQQLQAKRSVEALGTSSQGFIWPLNGAVTSYYGERWGRMHTGIDIDGYSGQMVVASKAGRVIMSSSYSGYGNTVIIDHGGGFSTLYAHLSAFDVSVGQDVAQGAVVGRVGCTGSCTGDHLHFEVRVNGSPTDPMQYLP